MFYGSLSFEGSGAVITRGGGGAMMCHQTTYEAILQCIIPTLGALLIAGCILESYTDNCERTGCRESRHLFATPSINENIYTLTVYDVGAPA
jgi:hypothetical protein